MFLRHLVRWPSTDIQVKFYEDRPRGAPPLRELNTTGVAEYIAILDLSNAISRKRCMIGVKLVLITNRKWHISFRLVPNSVTLDDLKGRNSPNGRLIWRAQGVLSSIHWCATSMCCRWLACYWRGVSLATFTANWRGINCDYAAPTNRFSELPPYYLPAHYDQKLIHNRAVGRNPKPQGRPAKIFGRQKRQPKVSFNKIKK